MAVYSVAHDVEDSGSEESGYHSSDVEDIPPFNTQDCNDEQHTSADIVADTPMTKHKDIDSETEVARAAPMEQ